MAIDPGAGSIGLSLPGDVYRATDRLKRLFSGIRGVKLVDHTYDCLRGDKVRRLLRASGAVGYLKPIAVGSRSPSERAAILALPQGTRRPEAEGWSRRDLLDTATRWYESDTLGAVSTT